MPPFASLNDQQRWDVVAYVLTLHTTPEQIAKGKELFEANCANCSTDFFKNQEKMSTLSEVDIARLIREGNDTVPAFGANFSDDDLFTVAAYLRTLSFDTTPLAQATTVPATQTPVAADAGTPSAEGTPVGTEQASAGSDATPVVKEGFGTISGSIENKTGTSLPSDLVVTLHGFDHSSADPSAGPQEALTQTGTVNADGTYTLENIEMPEGRIFVVDAAYSGVSLQSELGVLEAGQTALTLAPITLYELTDDTSQLVIDQLHMFVQSSADKGYEVIAVYTFRNAADKIVTVNMTDKQEIPFLKFLSGAEALGYEASQDSAAFISTNEGFAMAPSETPYGILAFSSVAVEKETTLTQELVIPATAIRIFVPDGMEAKGDKLTADSSQDVSGTTYQSYVANDFKAGDTLTFTLTGTPKVTDTTGTGTPSTSKNNTLLIGAGGLGLALILAGAWMYYRDRKRSQADDLEEDEDDEEEEEFESSEEVMDAIIALDDLHRAKKITEEAYQKRRAELKEILKGMM